MFGGGVSQEVGDGGHVPVQLAVRGAEPVACVPAVRRRVELDTLAGTLVVPFDQIEGIHVADSYRQGVRPQLRGWRPGLKLDWADFHQHLVLDKATGLFRNIAFSPDDPLAFRAALEEAFRAALEEAMAAYRQGDGRGPTPA